MVLSAIGIGAIGWLIFASNIFVVRTITVIGTVTPEVQQEINTLQGKHILLYSTHGMEDRLRAAQSSIDMLSISKGLPDTLLITVTQRKPALQWKSGNDEYMVDSAGVLFRLTETADSYKDLPSVVDQGALPVTPGSQVTSPAFVSFVRELADQFTREFPIGIDHIAIGQSMFELALHTDDGWYALFDTKRQVDPQLQALKDIIKHYHDAIHEYVDLRVSGKAFFQ